MSSLPPALDGSARMLPSHSSGVSCEPLAVTSRREKSRTSTLKLGISRASSSSLSRCCVGASPPSCCCCVESIIMGANCTTTLRVLSVLSSMVPTTL